MRHAVWTAFAALLVAAPLAAQAPLPLKLAPRPTQPGITPADLMTRLYIFADDSMMGRQTGTEYNLKGTAYIARELQRIGLEPGGENGTYFQELPLYTHALDPKSTITAGMITLTPPTDFLVQFVGKPKPINNAQVVFGGMAADTVNMLDPAAVRGKVLLLTPLSPQPANIQEFVGSAGYQRFLALTREAAAVALVGNIPPGLVRFVMEPTANMASVDDPHANEGPYALTITPKAADALLGKPIAQATKGATGATVTANIKFINNKQPGQNVIAILRGSDPQWKGEYIAIGAHNDHVGFSRTALDHDSLRAYNTIARPGGAEDQPRQPTAEEWTRINALKDSLHALHGGPRRDSINNGADDDGSGSMGVLEIAEAFAKSPTKPKRSIIFVWHTGEEMGMYGSGYFTQNPTVPRDSIMAALNIDMIGRGAASDVPNGGPGYLQLIGSRRLSTELGDIVEAVNKDTKAGFTFDYQYDANGEPHQFYCRSDHWSYGKWGIPVTFFSTGGHRDYHMRTDEPQYIDYEKLARVSQFVYDIAQRVANLDHRIVVDKPKPDPNAPCRQ
jgi:hypothetical protein